MELKKKPIYFISEYNPKLRRVCKAGPDPDVSLSRTFPNHAAISADLLRPSEDPETVLVTTRVSCTFVPLWKAFDFGVPISHLLMEDDEVPSA